MKHPLKDERLINFVNFLNLYLRVFKAIPDRFISKHPCEKGKLVVQFETERDLGDKGYATQY